MSRRPTLRDVALEADVAVSTVSGILNQRGDSWASRDTRDRVFEAARKLSYKPNRLARGLRLNRFMITTLIVPDLTNPLYAILARAFQRAMGDRGYELLVEETESDPQKEKRVLQDILEHHTDGIIGVLSSHEPHEARLTEIAERIPTLLIGQAVANSKIDTFESDFRKSFQEVIEHLEKLGHGKIGFVDSVGRNDPIDRLRIFHSLLQKNRLRFMENSWIRCTTALADIRASVRTWAETVPVRERATVLFCTNDMAAVCAIRGLLDAGVEVPRDLAIVGFDDIPLASYLTCPLTTIAQPIDAMAERATELLIQRIEGRHEGPPTHVALPTRLILRDSTALPAAPQKADAPAKKSGKSASKR